MKQETSQKANYQTDIQQNDKFAKMTQFSKSCQEGPEPQIWLKEEWNVFGL